MGAQRKGESRSEWLARERAKSAAYYRRVHPGAAQYRPIGELPVDDGVPRRPRNVTREQRLQQKREYARRNPPTAEQRAAQLAWAKAQRRATHAERVARWQTNLARYLDRLRAQRRERLAREAQRRQEWEAGRPAREEAQRVRAREQARASYLRNREAALARARVYLDRRLVEGIDDAMLVEALLTWRKLNRAIAQRVGRGRPRARV